MKKSTVTILVLALALVASNSWWAFQSLDFGVSFTYLEDSYRLHRKALTTAIAVLPVAAQATATPETVVEAAVAAAGGSEPFEKEGYVWVGNLGLQFGPEGRLASVKPAWDPY